MIRVKSEYQRKKVAKEAAAKLLRRTKARLGLESAQPSGGITPDPLVAGRASQKFHPLLIEFQHIRPN